MADNGQHLVIVSGMSGAGKSTVLHALEDMGYYCVDNLPATMLRGFGPHIQAEPVLYGRVALGVDARAPGFKPEEMPAWLESLRASGLHCQLLFVTADDETLLRRFSETRRRHPLARGEGGALQASIARERKLLAPVRESADAVLDTGQTNIHQLRHLTWRSVGPDSAGMTVVLQSFGFSHGIPGDADYIFDVRSLPNPHWDAALRPLTGRDSPVSDWLGSQAEVIEMSDDIAAFLGRWLPGHEAAHRSFVTVGVGCTGGRHRSVFVVERIAPGLREAFADTMVHHRDIES